MTTDAPRSDSPPDVTLSEGMTPDAILGSFTPNLRPVAARILVQQGEALRSEFRSDSEAEAFWAHVGEDAAIERANFGEHGMAQVPDPGERYCSTHDLYDCWMAH